MTTPPILFRSPSWSVVDRADWPWRYFSPREMACRCCGAVLAGWSFMNALDELRALYGAPLRVNSGYRCPAHNQRVSSSGPGGPHTTGLAVDLRASGGDALRLIRMAISIPFIDFTGVGIKQHGPHGGRYIHLDALPDAPGRPRPTVWSYP